MYFSSDCESYRYKVEGAVIKRGDGMAARLGGWNGEVLGWSQTRKDDNRKTSTYNEGKYKSGVNYNNWIFKKLF